MNAVPKIASATHGSTCGRAGLPRAWVEQMYADYLRLRSLTKVGQLHGRTRQSMYELFKRAGLKLYGRNMLQPVIYQGRTFTPGKGGYLRDTKHRTSTPGLEVQLHRQVWIDHHGAIPEGFHVGFKDGNKGNCSVDNLICLPLSEIQRLKATGINGYTRSARERLRLMVNHFESGEPSVAAGLKR